jgi:hypothetical protein
VGLLFEQVAVTRGTFWKFARVRACVCLQIILCVGLLYAAGMCLYGGVTGSGRLFAVVVTTCRLV